MASIGKALTAASGQVMNMAKTNPKNLGAAAKIATSTMASLIDAANIVAAIAPTPSMSDAVVNDMKDIIQKTATMLNYAKATAADPSISDSLIKSSKGKTH